MRDKDPNQSREFLLTFFLVMSVVFGFAGVLFKDLIYVISALALGFAFSRFAPGKQEKQIKLLITAGMIANLVWLVYSLANSSFLYREIIVIFVQKILIFEAIFAFGALQQPFLSSMQNLTIPLIMGQLVLVQFRGVYPLLLLLYSVLWLMIIKAKFITHFSGLERDASRKDRSVFISLAVFLAAVLTAWLLFSGVDLSRGRKRGFLLDPQSSADTSTENAEKQMYDLQEGVQEKIGGMITSLETISDSQNILFLLSNVMKDTPYAMEMDKAEQGLVSFLKSMGPGWDKKRTEEGLTMLKDYVDEKTAVNINKAKQEAMSDLKKSRLNIKDRFSLLDQINKMQFSKDLESMQQFQSRAEELINNSFTDKREKQELMDSVNKLKDWKTFDFYRSKKEKVSQKIESLGGEESRKLEELAQKIEEARDSAGTSGMQEKLSRVKEELADMIDSLDSDLKKELEGILKAIDRAEASSDLKQLASELRSLKQEVQKRADSQRRSQAASELKDVLEQIKKAEGSSDMEEIKDNLEQLKSGIQSRLYSMEGQSKDELKDVLDKLDEASGAQDMQGVRKELGNLESMLQERIDRLWGAPKKELKELLSRIEQADNSSELKKANDLLQGLRQELPEQMQEVMGELEEAAKLKTDMLVSQNAQTIREEIDDSHALSDAEKERLQEKARRLGSAGNIKDFLDDASEFKEQSESAKLNIDESLKELVSAKKNSFAQQKAAEIRELIEDSALNEASEGMLKELEKMKSSNDDKELSSAFQQLSSQIDKASEDGFLSEASRSKLLQDIADMKDMISFEQRQGAELLSAEVKQEYSDYQAEINQAIKDSSLNPEQKSVMEDFSRELFQADSVSKLQDISDAAQKQANEYGDDERMRKIKEQFSKAAEIKRRLIISQKLSGVEENLRKLQKAVPGASEVPGEALRKIKSSATDAELAKNMKKLKDYVDSISDQAKESPKKVKAEFSWQVYILPDKAIIPMDKSITLKAVAVYDNKSIRQIGSEGEWLTSNNLIAWMDAKGVVRGVSPGVARVWVRYQGVLSEPVEITVLNRIPQEVTSSINQEVR